MPGSLKTSDRALSARDCSGRVFYIVRGAIASLDEPALNAVLLHERRHAHSYDPLWLATGRVLSRALFFVPGLRQLAAQQQALAELSADESAIDAAPENRSALARAMLSFAGNQTPAKPQASTRPGSITYWENRRGCRFPRSCVSPGWRCWLSSWRSPFSPGSSPPGPRRSRRHSFRVSPASSCWR